MTDRVHDPALSEKGVREADGAARGVLAATGGTGQVVASPMLRALHSMFREAEWAIAYVTKQHDSPSAPPANGDFGLYYRVA